MNTSSPSIVQSDTVIVDTDSTQIKDALPAGTRLQNYILERTIGHGGFGITYLGTEKLTGRRVVIKENFPQQYVYRDPQDAVTVHPRPGHEGAYDWSKQSFIKEAVTLIGLPYNPHVVQVLSVLEDHNTAYIVMPLIEGCSLHAGYLPPATMPESELRDFLQSILGALAHLHAHNVIHRDIKPDNILITPEGKPVLIDFGAARPDTPMVSATQIGTRGYAPPEQISPKLYDKHPKPHADIYALGATCYRLITGYEPDYVPYQLAQDSAINGSYSSGLLSSIDKARDLLPANRWQSAQEWIDAISAPSEEQMAEMVAKARKLINEQRYSDIMAVLRPALEQNYAPAQFIMGDCYINGYGVEKDPQMVEYWMKRAAEQNYFLAQFYLAEGYRTGKEIPCNPQQAFYWYRKTAEQNHPASCFFVGYFYEKGQGVPEDLQQAIHWYKKGAELNHSGTQYRLGYFYESGIGVEKNPQLALYWYRKAAEQNYALAQYKLGTCYQDGTGTEKSPQLAFHWYRKAAEQNHVNAQFYLGDCYFKGKGTEKSPQLAFHWYRKAAEQNHDAAQFYLGYCYNNGIGTEKSPQLAVHWYRKAAEQNFPVAQNNLGTCYLHGTGVEKDARLAALWYRKAAEQNFALAMDNLGYCYECGLGVPRDINQAVYWYRKAADNGCQSAKDDLKRLGR